MRRTTPLPKQLAHTPFDVIVMGAGINGTGIARDAALRGLRVLLVDKGDICDGTSAWSSRLIHGGLRYLAHGEFSLVRGSLHERACLLRLAPHLVHPLPFAIPFYTYWDALSVPIGLRLYDWFSQNGTFPRHRLLSRRRFQEQVPGINTKALKGGAIYTDAAAPMAERLCVENALAAAEHGAVVITYVRADEFIFDTHDANRVTGVVLTDLLDTGAARHSVHAPLVMNATGPWVDKLLAAGAIVTDNPFMGGTKGSHVIVNPFPGAPDRALYFKAPQDKRPLFIIPWGELYLLGTTDCRHQDDLDHLRASQAEIDYILTAVNSVIPSANLHHKHICYTYAGVRPLPWHPKGKPGSVTRRHIIHDHAPEYEGLVSIIGGKLTTYRGLSEEAVDIAFQKLGKAAPDNYSASINLPGARTADFTQFQKWFLAQAPFDSDVCARLLSLYGTRSLALWALCKRTPRLQARLRDDVPAIAAEVVFAFESEMAQTLSDVLLRRTMLGLRADLGQSVIPAAAKVAAEYFGWDEARVTREIEHCQAAVERFTPVYK